MRAAVIFFADKNIKKLSNISKTLGECIKEKGHHVDIIDGANQADIKLYMYKYIAIGTESTSFFGKISRRISERLSNSGDLMGRKCFAFILHSTFGAMKALGSLMKALEKEGMVIKFSEIIKNKEQARQIGSNLHIDVKN